MRYILTQHYTLEHTELYNLTSTINQAYAQKIGFEYISNNQRRCSNRAVWWEKIAWLMELTSTVEDNTLIAYEDCDSINLGGDLKTALHDNKEYGMIQLRGGLGNSQLLGWYNAGVIILLNTPDVRSFLQRVWNRNDDTDETSINKELKSLNGRIGNSKSICSLEPSWNCWHNNEHLVTDIYIKSWHGIRYQEKLEAIKIYLKK